MLEIGVVVTSDVVVVVVVGCQLIELIGDVTVGVEVDS